MRLVKALFIAAVGLTSLSACVGADPQARLRTGSGTSQVSAVPIGLDPVEPAQPLMGVMPGDLLLEPKRRLAGIDPQTVLMRSNTHVANVTATPPRHGATHAAHVTEGPAPMRAAGSSASAQTSAFFATPLGAAGSPNRTPSTSQAASTLGDVETRAGIEQQAQEGRNRRFDAQVRRASSIVCSGCVSTTERKPARALSSGGESDD